MKCPHCDKETSTKFKVRAFSPFSGKIKELWFDLEKLGIAKKEKEDADQEIPPVLHGKDYM